MKLVILDRDGVINRDSDDYIKSVDEFQLLDGSVEAIAKLNRHGFTVAIATNQSGLARELFKQEDLEAMHAKLASAVADAGGKIDAIFYCPHGPDDGCNCRKPLPGLIEAIENHFAISAKGWPMVGDSLRDLEAGLARGCDPILVRTGKGLRTLPKLEQLNAEVQVFDDLQAASGYIIDHY
ncbi:MAG: D-glycero-beta-D-manno-heptose 1,7-bisphosphate 7-phosphatase [Candidatus Pelagadaptatus aseana]|uniref:D-glycero-beta-D-manno-heptose 1,7-bisphosphate 7-phosphatase n=1 Tax=Candidatus Pelagadaptatus aseana TaxID=3120508 RepID=UPI0039B20772